MNSLKINNVLYKYEFFWRKSKDDKTVDYNNKLLPYPVHNDQEWEGKDTFIEQLEEVQRDLYAHNKFIPYSKEEYKDCLLCSKKNITTGLYNINNIRWENGMKHYIRKHNIEPSNDFQDFIYRYANSRHNKEHVVARFTGVKVVKNEKKYLKLDRNQILIMDALMEHGGYKIYKDKKRKKNIYKYSEHAGLLDFNNTGLEKVIVSGNTTMVDAGDQDIFLPKNMYEAYDYEYIFHTHPPTPKPGGRVAGGILYEFPSISDMFHFMDHYNDGKTQGSIVITPEGMYIIRKHLVNDKKIYINEDRFYNATMNVWTKIQKHAIAKYGKRFSLHTFYSKIAQDRYYIDMFNKVLNKYKIHIDYYSRIFDGKSWVIDTIYLPVYAIEFKRNVA
jgi:hypothetical protein